MKIFKTRSFNWWEIGLLKLCLVSFGIILGLYFYDVFIWLMPLWLALFLLTAIYFIARLFRGK